MILFTAQSGILYPFCWLLGKVLDLIYQATVAISGNEVGNLAVCIIIFTIVVKLFLLPLNIKQQKGAKINQFIQPEIHKIQKKYKNRQDQESMMKMQQETQAVYKKYGTSMTNGCLTSFIQLPIIYALYRVIYNIPAYVPAVKKIYSPVADEITGVNDFVTVITNFVNDNKVTTAARAIKNIGKLDPASVGSNNVIDVISQFSTSQWDVFKSLKEVADNAGLVNAIDTFVPKLNELNTFILGINISEAPGWKIFAEKGNPASGFNWALLIPIFAALFQFLSVKVTQKTQPTMDDPTMAQTQGTMKIMTYSMPLMSLFFCVTLPAAIGIYWTASAALAFVTTLLINLYYDKVANMDKIMEKQMAKAAKKHEKHGDKKSLTEKFYEMAGMSDTTENSTNSVANINLKNYANTNTSGESKTSSNPGAYKKGSLASKANIMQDFNNNEKEK